MALIDLIHGQTTRNDLSRDGFRSMYDFASGTIGQREEEPKPIVAFGSGDGNVQQALHDRIQPFQIPNRAESHAISHHLVAFIHQEPTQQAHQRVDLCLRTRPILGRKTIQCEHVDSEFAGRADILQLIARQMAAERVASDAWKERLPSVSALFTPQFLAPSGLFNESRSWRASVLFSVPLFDSGLRKGLERERFALVDVVRAERANVERQAASDIRTAREAIQSTERALARAQEAATQANEVVRITDVAFREGATTNIEVIDAQRRARDAETAAVIAEDAVRRARLELLVSTGRFPQ